MIPISFGLQVCGDPSQSAAREWLVPDGCGGYAMGTIGGLLSRRYHGLLVVAGEQPGRRHVGLVALDPVLRLPSGAQLRLGVHEWHDGARGPDGHIHLERFDLVDGLPRWRWRVGDVVLERELAMAHGRPAVAVVHRLVAGGPVRLGLDALCTWRDAHGERFAGGPPPVVAPVAGGITVEDAYRVSGPGWEPTGQWWYGAHHRAEAERGLNPVEDLWHAGRFTGTLDEPGATVEVLAWAGDLGTAPPAATRVIAAAHKRNRAVVAAAKPADAAGGTLALAADAFVVTTPTGPDVVAGYPWFGAWSRDTMIAYEGLLLATRRGELGRNLLRGYAATLSEGMLANTADTGHTEYNTVDATLWFVHAVERHVTVTGDTDLAAELLPALRGVVDAHLKGTRYGIHADPGDGLLDSGAAGVALTWMDARVNGVPVTPRAGKPVEVNALWVNALGAVCSLASLVGEEPGTVRDAHRTARAAFRRRFPAPSGWLYDVVDAPPQPYPLGGDDTRHPDDSLRPNQLLAWSLPHAPLAPEPAALRAVEASLLTPLGPRSLAPSEPGYLGGHRGGPAERDGAYHMGTVWPWLIGPYADARVKAGIPHGELFAGLEAHLAEFGLGSVSETADGRPPHSATGCPFQAWSVGELLRVRRG